MKNAVAEIPAGRRDGTDDEVQISGRVSSAPRAESGTEMVFTREFSPASMQISLFAIDSRFARKVISFLLAAPSTGGAAIRIRSSPAVFQPRSFVAGAEGWTRTRNPTLPSFLFTMSLMPVLGGPGLFSEKGAPAPLLLPCLVPFFVSFLFASDEVREVLAELIHAPE